MRPILLKLIAPCVAASAFALTAAAVAQSPGQTTAASVSPPKVLGLELSWDSLAREHAALVEVSASASASATAVAPVSPTPTPTPATALALDASALAKGGIPAASLAAYRRAAASLAVADPSCKLPWNLLAAIGRVESGHGRSNGAVVLVNGRSEPVIRGPVLDGRGPFALIRDSDRGVYDGDLVFDRAVGPMQFLPGTWRVSGRDGDRNGIKDPHDVDDAALGSGVYLCAGAADMSNPASLRRAIWRYNHSDSYVELVVAVMARYGAVPPGVLPNAVVAPVPVRPLAVPPKTPASPTRPIVDPLATPPASPTASASSSPSAYGSGSGSGSPTSTPSSSATPSGSPSGSASGSASPSSSPSPSGSASASDSPSPTDSPSPAPSTSP